MIQHCSAATASAGDYGFLQEGTVSLPRESPTDRTTYFMHRTPFPRWLTAREQIEVPDATLVIQLISQAGAAGITHHDLRHAVPGLEPDTLDGLLDALDGVGQITVALVDGRRVYRTGV
jgi:hypothetical protein